MGKVTSRPQILKAPEDYDAILTLVKTYEPVSIILCFVTKLTEWCAFTPEHIKKAQ